jgi:hypothetical protein
MIDAQRGGKPWDDLAGQHQSRALKFTVGHSLLAAVVVIVVIIYMLGAHRDNHAEPLWLDKLAYSLRKILFAYGTWQKMAVQRLKLHRR